MIIRPNVPIQRDEITDKVLEYFRNKPTIEKWIIMDRDRIRAKLRSLDAALSEIRYMTKTWTTQDASKHAWEAQLWKEEDIDLLLEDRGEIGDAPYIIDEPNNDTTTIGKSAAVLFRKIFSSDEDN